MGQIENQAQCNNRAVPPPRFADLSHGEKARIGCLFGGISLVVMVVTALCVHCYHRYRSARALRQAHDGNQAQVQHLTVLQGQLAASQARVIDLEIQLGASQDRSRALQAQFMEAGRRYREIFEAENQEQIYVLQRQLTLAQEASDLQKRAQQTTYTMYMEAMGEVESLRHLLPAEANPVPMPSGMEVPAPHEMEVELPPMMLAEWRTLLQQGETSATPPAHPLTEATDDDSDYLSAS